MPMKKILVTGSDGFLGKNLCAALRSRKDVELTTFDKQDAPAVLDAALASADLIYHLAGVNRPKNVAEFKSGNADLTGQICSRLEALGRRPTIVFSSSIQAALANPYGESKLAAEEALKAFAAKTGARVVVHRFSNLFGKWSRPNYNTVTATFCYNIARGLPIEIRDPAYRLDLSYVDDVVEAFLAEIALENAPGGFVAATPVPAHNISLGELAALVGSFKNQRESLLLPNFAEPFVRKLYATYLSFLPQNEFAYNLVKRTDPHGSLAEFVKAPGAGQIFVSRTKPGITRGNHFHHTKVEKFLVVEGEGIVRFRNLEPGADGKVIEYRVSGEDYRVVDIPPGYTHSIENTGKGVMVTLFWSSEVFNPARPDTLAEPVLPPATPNPASK
jgi:UDP-2-acetamido-2,6-beta-L-arabino-hexul-4-ose reductase